MKIKILGSGTGACPDFQYVSSYLVNGRIAIDAGALGMYGSPAEQSIVRHIFLTHAHIDHIATLPLFFENAFEPGREPVLVYGHAEALAALHKYILNDVIWPDFVRLSRPGWEFLRLCPLEAEKCVRVDGLSIVPVCVDHTVATFGYIVTDGTSTVIFGADSGPTDRIWQLAANTAPPRSVVLEACFPDSLHELAQLSRHLTPSLFAAEVSKMPDMSTIIAVHIKPRFRQTTVDELLGLNIPNLVIGTPNSEYQL